MAWNSLPFLCCFSHSSQKLPVITGKPIPSSSTAQTHHACFVHLINADFFLWFIPAETNFELKLLVFAICLQLPNLDRIIIIKSMGCSCSKACFYFFLSWKDIVAGVNPLWDTFLSAPCLMQAQTTCNFITLYFNFANLLTNWCLKLTSSKKMGFRGGFGGVSSERYCSFTSAGWRITIISLHIIFSYQFLPNLSWYSHLKNHLSLQVKIPIPTYRLRKLIKCRFTVVQHPVISCIQGYGWRRPPEISQLQLNSTIGNRVSKCNYMP